MNIDKTKSPVDKYLTFKGEEFILVGTEYGLESRIFNNMDECDKDDCVYIMILPKKVEIFNTSFTLGFIGPSISKLGIDKFREKYIFDHICSSATFMACLEDGISRYKHLPESIKKERGI